MTLRSKVCGVGLVAFLTLALAGCGTVGGPGPVMTRGGPADTRSDAGPAAVFVAREATARAASVEEAHQASLLMLVSGMSLAQANCRDYFASAGRNQRNVIVTRQIVNAMGALAVTLMLMDNVDPDSIALVELGQGTVNSGLDIWTQNYLFAAENISTVEDLVIQAEEAYAAEARVRTNLDYEKATALVMGHQAICAPRRIASLVLEAVKAGTVVPAATGSGAASVAVIRDREARRRLADMFGVPGVLSDSQTGALWWLFMSYSTPETRSGQITTLLGPLAASLLDKGAINTDWHRTEDVRQALMLLSTDAQVQLIKIAADTQKAEDERARTVAAAAARAEQALEIATNNALVHFRANDNDATDLTEQLSPAQRTRFLDVLGDRPEELVDGLNGRFLSQDFARLLAAEPTIISPVPLATFVVPRPSAVSEGEISLTVE